MKRIPIYAGSLVQRLAGGGGNPHGGPPEQGNNGPGRGNGGGGGNNGNNGGGGPARNVDSTFSSNVALLPLTGANNSTSFPDYAPPGTVWTARGGAKVDSSQNPFGSGGSMLLSADGDYIDAAAPATPPERPMDFSDLFTIEGWFRASGFTTSFASMFASASPFFSVLASAIMLLGDSQGVNARKISGVLRGNESNTVGTTTINALQWYHFALTRDGSNVLRTFLHGTVQGSTPTNANQMAFQTSGVRIGRNGWDGAQGQFFGHLSNIRAKKGVCLYTGNFTPPTQPFPLS